jgi:hypothetical protein
VRCARLIVVGLGGKDQRSGSGETLNYIDQILDGFVPLVVDDYLVYATFDVVVQHHVSDSLRRTQNGGYLDQDIDTILVFVDHPLNTAQLPLDAFKARQDFILVGGI